MTYLWTRPVVGRTIERRTVLIVVVPAEGAKVGPLARKLSLDLVRLIDTQQIKAA